LFLLGLRRLWRVSRFLDLTSVLWLRSPKMLCRDNPPQTRAGEKEVMLKILMSSVHPSVQPVTDDLHRLSTFLSQIFTGLVEKKWALSRSRWRTLKQSLYHYRFSYVKLRPTLYTTFTLGTPKIHHECSRFLSTNFRRSIKVPFRQRSLSLSIILRCSKPLKFGFISCSTSWICTVHSLAVVHIFRPPDLLNL
jgi:hypothetical protein